MRFAVSKTATHSVSLLLVRPTWDLATYSPLNAYRALSGLLPAPFSEHEVFQDKLSSRVFRGGESVVVPRFG
jgi:hypothetical protein